MPSYLFLGLPKTIN